MNTENYTNLEKVLIANQIKNIDEINTQSAVSFLKLKFM